MFDRHWPLSAFVDYDRRMALFDERRHELAQGLAVALLERRAWAHAVVGKHEQIVITAIGEAPPAGVDLADTSVDAAQYARCLTIEHAELVRHIVIAIEVGIDRRHPAIDVQQDAKGLELAKHDACEDLEQGRQRRQGPADVFPLAEQRGWPAAVQDRA